MTNSNFTNADFSESTGLTGNGTNKSLDTLVNQTTLYNGGQSAGMGYWARVLDYTGTTTEVMGSYNNTNTVRNVLDLRALLRFFSWGNAGTAANSATASVVGDYYGQRANLASRELYVNGSLLVSNTTSDGGSPGWTLRLMGIAQGGGPTVDCAKGSCAVAYCTDGTLTPTEIAAFHTVLQTYLITPTGR